MNTVTLTIEGMSCNHCVMALKKELSQNEIKVLDASVGSANIEYDETKVSAKQIEDAVAEAGYKLVKVEQTA